MVDWEKKICEETLYLELIPIVVTYMAWNILHIACRFTLVHTYFFVYIVFIMGPPLADNHQPSNLYYYASMQVIMLPFYHIKNLLGSPPPLNPTNTWLWKQFQIWLGFGFTERSLCPNTKTQKTKHKKHVNICGYFDVCGHKYKYYILNLSWIFMYT